jgi:hypothetical protein
MTDQADLIAELREAVRAYRIAHAATQAAHAQRYHLELAERARECVPYLQVEEEMGVRLADLMHAFAGVEPTPHLAYRLDPRVWADDDEADERQPAGTAA